LYLAAAGVGTIGLVDDDRVSLSNLQRQIAHMTPSVGRLKVESAAETLSGINPHVHVETHATRLTEANARGLISAYDIVADGSDNFATRYLVSDTCAAAGRTLVFGAVGPFDGYVTTFKPHTTKPDGSAHPSYRDLFPEAPADGTVLNCAEVGVLGAVTGVIGTLQAVEVIKEICGIGDSLVGRLLIYDALTTRFETMRY
ncbi:MAG: ThiF family adenylyltransferase, partial [Pseudomonadota bacterium]